MLRPFFAGLSERPVSCYEQHRWNCLPEANISISTRLRQTVDRVLREQLTNIGYERCEIAEAYDHDGDPILKIKIHYMRVGDSVDPTPTFSIARHLREAMRKFGEERFPHFTHLFPEDQELKVA